jgi:hypothetical protein
MLVDLHLVGRKCAINQQGVNGVLPRVGVGRFVKKLHALITHLLTTKPYIFASNSPSMRMDLYNLFTTSFFLLSSSPNVLSSSMVLKAHTSSKRIFFFLPTSPNTSLFHLIQSTFKALSVLATTKSNGSEKSPTTAFTLTSKPFDFSHIFSNLKISPMEVTTIKENLKLIQTKSRKSSLGQARKLTFPSR